MENHPESLKIAFDECHDNSIEIETSAYGGFIEYFFQQNLKIGKLTEKISWDKLKDFNLLIIGNPNNEYSIKEIYTVLEFLKSGGNILIFSDEGADVSNQTNLNELTSHLGFKILPNIIYDPGSNAGKEVQPIIQKFETHPITSDVSSIVLASGCSFELLKQDEFLEYMDVSVKSIAFCSATSKMKMYHDRQWNELTAKESSVIITGRYFDGRFVCLGTPSILSSLSSVYGLEARDNLNLIRNILRWLLEERESTDLTATLFGDQVEVLVKIKKELWNWTRSIASVGEWGDFSKIVNYSLKLLRKAILDKQQNSSESKIDN